MKTEPKLENEDQMKYETGPAKTCTAVSGS